MRRGQAIGAAVATVLALLAMTWAAGSDTVLVDAPSGAARSVTLVPVDVTAQTLTVAPLPSLTRGTGGGLPVDWLVILAGIVLVGLLVLLLRYLLGRLWSQDEPPPQDEEDTDLAELVAATSPARLLALGGGDPRNAVVACWVALEDAAERGGLRPDPAETSAEFTIRVLGRWEVDQPTIDRLAILYREARFSRHPVTEQMRAEAVETMRSVHDQLHRRLVVEREAADSARAAAESTPADRTDNDNDTSAPSGGPR